MNKEKKKEHAGGLYSEFGCWFLGLFPVKEEGYHDCSGHYAAHGHHSPFALDAFCGKIMCTHSLRVDGLDNSSPSVKCQYVIFEPRYRAEKRCTMSRSRSRLPLDLVPADQSHVGQSSRIREDIRREKGSA